MRQPPVRRDYIENLRLAPAMKNAIRRRSMLMAKSRKPRNDEEHTRFAQSQLGFEYLSVHDDGMAELELIGTDGSVLYREALVKKD